jgi:serine/threonine-protein kinase
VSDGPKPDPAELADATRLAPLLDLQSGRILGHTYEIEQLLARGGMGAVYRARHVDLGSVHAIKVILPELAEDPRVISLFQEEANKLRRLRHDAIVAYEGLFRDESGARYLVMEFVDGPSLADRMKSGALSLPELRQLRDRCAAGLAAAHAKGIVHRDISPDNIILVEGRADLAKIIDFGIAKSTNPGDRTIIGRDFAGKFAYVSPEQLDMVEGGVDARSDMYSLGLVLAAAALGEPLPIGGGPIQAIQARRKVLDLSGVPEPFRTEITPMLALQPADRPSSLLGLLGPVAEATGEVTLLPGRAALPDAPVRRSRGAALAIGGLAAAALLGIGGAAWLYSRGGGEARHPAATESRAAADASVPVFEPPAAAPPQPQSLDLPPPLVRQAESAQAAGQVLRDCPDCPELVVVPAGEFMMGDTTRPESLPIHRVRVGAPLAVGRFPVLRGEYDKFAREISADHAWRKPGIEQSDRDPVVRVSWADAQLYVHWLSLKSGRSYRLLRAAEWEWAARAGAETAYPWGDEPPRGNADCDGCGSGFDGRRTAPAASFAANRFGLYDMAGNVWQWVEDCWTPNYSNAPSDAAQLPGPAVCTDRELRGGAWDSRPQALRSGGRLQRPATNRSNDAGFRIARALAP